MKYSDSPLRAFADRQDSDGPDGLSRANGNVNNNKREALFSDIDAIDEVGGLSEASRGEVAILFVVQDQSFSHGL